VRVGRRAKRVSLLLAELPGRSGEETLERLGQTR
jgi:hypothetical protein